MAKFGDRWVKRSDKRKLEAGYIKIGRRWVKFSKEKLLAKGYRIYQGKWYTREDIIQLRSQWEHAWTYQTENFHIQCNISEKFTKELGSFMEQALVKYKNFFNHDENFLSKKLMKVQCFKNVSEFRDNCIRMGLKNALFNNFSGFAYSRTNTLYIRLDESKEDLLATALHEGAHLYHYHTIFSHQIYNICSFNSEGIATQFEGYQWKNGKLSIILNTYRLSHLKEIIENGQAYKIRDFMTIKQANKERNIENLTRYYHQWWGMYYFLKNTKNKEYQTLFKDYFHKIMTTQLGTNPNCFVEYFSGKLEQIEKDMHTFFLML